MARSPALIRMARAARVGPADVGGTPAPARHVPCFTAPEEADMVLGWTMAALAGPAGDATSAAPETEPMCEPPVLAGALPADGATDVPLDAIVTLLVTGTAPLCGVSALVADDRGNVEPAPVEVAGEVVRVRPAALSPDRTYTVAVQFSAGSIETSFSTGDGVAGPIPAPTGVQLAGDAVCGFTLEIAAAATATVEPAADGVLALAVVGGSFDVEVDHVALPAGAVSLEGVAQGVPDPCLLLRLYDVTGAVAWESEPECLDVECPIPDPIEELALSVERLCDGASTAALVSVDLPAQPADAGGALVAELVTERASGRSEAFAWTPGATVDIPVAASGDRDACATVTYLDLWGEERWTSPAVCAPPGEGCPGDDDLDGVGGCAGCAGGGGAPVGWAALAIGLAIGHRRRRS
jgi:MYXO-CTERM domain-containing protein